MPSQEIALQGIDVSYAQGQVDWEKVKGAGIRFAILRAGFGREASQKDRRFEENYAACKAAGIPIGVYHYSYAVSPEDARREAKACLAWLSGKTLEYPVFCDLEDNSMAHLGRETLTQIALAFCEEIQKAGFRPGIYANKHWCTNLLDMSRLSQYPLWLAQYHTQITYTGKVDMWQYTSTGRVAGVSGNVDCNECYTDLTAQKSGWIQQDGKWWYCHADGSYTKSGWEQIGGKWYYFDASGWMQTGWLQQQEKRYYLGEDGAMVYRWQEISGCWYWFDPSGEMAAGWKEISGKRYFFNGEGQLQTGWFQYKDRWYCAGPDGALYAGTWKKLGGKWYLFEADGKAHEGWYQAADGRWYYLNPGSCEMVTHWLELDGRWYYFSPKASGTWKEGEMVKGKQTINDKVYYFAEKTEGEVKEGEMLS